MRFLAILKAAENQGTPPQALMDAIAKLGEEETRAGVLVGVGGLLPSATGARVRVSGGRLTLTDGPFAESKEVIGSYTILEVNSREEAIEWVTRFMQLHQEHWEGWEGESEIRQVFDATEFANQ